MFLKRDSSGNLIIASRHPRWSLTWSWVLTWMKQPSEKLFWAVRTNPRSTGLYGQVRIGRLHFERQATMPLSA